MNEQEHHELRTSLGTYALGQLPPSAASALEAHLAGCPECTAELAELAPVAGALDLLRTPSAAVETAVAPPAELGDRVVAAVTDVARREQRRTRWRAAAVAGAAAGVVLVTALGFRALTSNDPVPDPAVPLEAVEVRSDQSGVKASADLVDHTWGVEVKLTASGLDRGGRYRVTVIGVNGKRYPAGGFVGTGAAEMDCNLNSSVLRDRASGFEVRDVQGEVVVSSAFG